MQKEQKLLNFEKIVKAMEKHSAGFQILDYSVYSKRNLVHSLYKQDK